MSSILKYRLSVFYSSGILIEWKAELDKMCSTLSQRKDGRLCRKSPVNISITDVALVIKLKYLTHSSCSEAELERGQQLPL